ncbi:adenylate/guanylate cyclase domain-containing protein [Ahrensia sp. R2A130]|uniref:adenylate/guanylate cyclase domain-containing protein n=1 Tax=Ahrensia sp. R2A130 TaxID=744979 RepID=UPI0001E0F0CC|nr:adenylate/guanylate cyclase domain-containing protein [Ahrensia sp. R2A130]EFL89185.1 putative adenylate cyclase 3 [Ahrensia sp. R2A130]
MDDRQTGAGKLRDTKAEEQARQAAADTPSATAAQNDPDGYTWKQSCPVFVDAVGYSTSVEKAPKETRKRLAKHFRNLGELVECNGGRIIDTAGDGMFAEFSSVASALEGMTTFQTSVLEANEELPVDHRMRFRCGVSFGNVLQEEHLISGPKVNIAARLQQMAEPGSINIDGEAHRQVSGSNIHRFIDMGFRVVKGMSDPVRVYRVAEGDEIIMEPSARLAASYDAKDGNDRDATSGEEGDHWFDNARGIAVLPFEVPPGSRMDKEEDAYMAMGMASDIADALSRSNWLKVISPRSSLNYSEATWADNEIARDLGVRYLLKGRIRSAGTMMRVSASLVECPTGTTVWSENYDRRDGNIFDIQDEITTLIVAMIEPEFLRHETERAADTRPRDMSSWDLLMRARWHFWRGSPRHVRSAMVCAEKALQLEPDSAQILALLSFCHMTQAWTGWAEDPEKQAAEALRLARLAVNRDDTNPNAHFTLGTALSLIGDVGPALAAERRALELNPNFASALGEIARLSALDDQPEAARRAALRAIALSPSDPHISLWVYSLALASFVEGDFAAAADFARESAAKRPDWFFHHHLLAASEALAGNPERARQAMAESERILPGYTMPALEAGVPFVRRRNFDKLVEGMRLAGWTG